MAKVVTAPVSGLLSNPVSAANQINANFDAIEVAIENTLSRNGAVPNQMGADLDLNSNDLLNVGSLGVSRIDASSIYIDGEAVLPGGGGGSDPSDTVTSVAGRTGDVVLTKSDVGLGNIDNTSDVSKPVSTAQASSINLRLLKTANLSDLNNTITALTNLGGTIVGRALFVAADAAQGRSTLAAAPLASPTFTGTPAAPTATTGTNTTQIATTAFVTAAIAALSTVFQPLASYLTSLVGLGTTGIVVKNGATALTRQIDVGPSILIDNATGVAGNPTLRLNAASGTDDPVNNEDIAFKRTSDTVLTVSMRGSDGTVRSVDLTLV